MMLPGESLQRYEQLKDSVRVLREELRGSRVPSRKSSRVTNVTSTVCPSPDGGFVSLDIEEIDPLESFSMQHLRLQFKIELQKKREEIKKLIANQRGKSQQIENLENEHRVQRRKLEARIEHQSEKICALEAQLSNRISLNQQDLQAQAYAFAAKLRQCENEKCQQMVSVRAKHEATVASLEKHHCAELNQAQVIYFLSLKRAENAEAKLKEVEEELAVLKQHKTDTRDLIKKKDEDCNLKMDDMKSIYEDQIQDLRARLRKVKGELVRVKVDLTKQHALELHSYKMQKAVEIDEVSERVRATVMSKDASISFLKDELAKQHEQASWLLDIS